MSHEKLISNEKTGVSVLNHYRTTPVWTENRRPRICTPDTMETGSGVSQEHLIDVEAEKRLLPIFGEGL